MKLQVYLLIAIVFFLIASWINLDLNPLHWGTLTKIIYSIILLWSIRVFGD
jgi:hypothetical protein